MRELLEEDPNDPMNERHASPGTRKGVRKIVWMAAGLAVMFVIAAGIVATSIGVLQRPGADPGAVQKAPAD
ncbi:hypothetical protein NRB_00050 [Novosphingobium sp. 11B]